MSNPVYYLWTGGGPDSVAKARAWTPTLKRVEPSAAPSALRRLWQLMDPEGARQRCSWLGDGQGGFALQLDPDHEDMHDLLKEVLQPLTAALQLYFYSADPPVLYLPDGSGRDAQDRPFRPDPMTAAEPEVDPHALLLSRKKPREELARVMAPYLLAAGWKEGTRNILFKKQVPAGTWQVVAEDDGHRTYLEFKLVVKVPAAIRARADSFHFPTIDFDFGLQRACERLRSPVKSAGNNILTHALKLPARTWAEASESAQMMGRLLAAGLVEELHGLSSEQQVCEAALTVDRAACPFDYLCP